MGMMADMPNTLKSGSEDVDIKAVIEAETTAYLNQDVDALCDCWVQEPYLQHTTILPYCGVVQVHGIKGLRNHFVEDFKLETPLKIESQAVGRKNWKIVVRDRMAWVTFEQFVVSDRSGHMSGEQMHTRILEKISGRWKIAASTGVLSRLDFYDCPKLQVDGSGHVKQIDQESRDVIEGHPVLNITGGRLFANTQQDATRLKNALQSAQRNIESGKARMPVPLIFGDDQGSGSPLCWIAILDMKIVILLDDIRLVEATIVSRILWMSPPIRSAHMSNGCLIVWV